MPGLLEYHLLYLLLGLLNTDLKISLLYASIFMFYHTTNFTGQVKWDTHHKSKYQVFEINVFQQLNLETTKIHACSVILLQNSVMIRLYFHQHRI